MLIQKLATLNRRKYFSLLALATVAYYAGCRIFQDWYYQGKFDQLRADFFMGYAPNPEPLEIPLYILGYVAIPVFAYILCLFPKKILWPVGGILGILGLGIFFAKFKIDLPDPGVYWAYLQTKGIGQALWLTLTKRIFLLRVLVAASIVFFILAYYFWRDSWSRFFENNRNLSVLRKLEPIFFIAIAILIFHPNLPYEEHHYSAVIGTVNDMLQGKQFLSEVMNQYGIINIYFLYYLFKFFGPLTYEKLSFVMFFSYLFFYTGIYHFIRKWLSSNLYAYLGTGIIVAVTYLLQVSPTLSALFYPGLIPFRFGLYVVVLILLLNFSKNQNSRAREWAIIVSCLSIFWNIDSGAYLVAATFLTLAYHDFRLKSLLLLTAKFIAYPGVIFLLINIVNFLAMGSFPNWNLFLEKMFARAVANPLPLFGFFEVFIFVYLAVFLRARTNLMLFFIATYGALSFIYYVNNSEWNVFYPVAVPLILIILYYSHQAIRNRFVFAMFSMVLFFSFMVFLTKLPVEFQNRNYQALGRFTWMDEYDKDLRADVMTLRERYGFLKRLPVIHQRDTKFLVLAEKTNYFDIFILGELNTYQLMDRLIATVKTDTPEYLFIGNLKNDQIGYVEERILSDYIKVESLNTLDVYQRKS